MRGLKCPQFLAMSEWKLESLVAMGPMQRDKRLGKQDTCSHVL